MKAANVARFNGSRRSLVRISLAASANEENQSEIGQGFCLHAGIVFLWFVTVNMLKGLNFPMNIAVGNN